MVAVSEHIKVPELRFPEFSGEWEKCSVTNRFKIARGRFSPRPRNNPIYYGGDYPFAQTSDVVNSGGSLSNASQSLNEKGISVSKLFPAKSIFMTIAANIGYVAEIQNPMACPDSLVGIQIDEDDSSRYVLYGLSRIQKRLDFIAPEAAQKNLSLAELSLVKIHLPSLPEQQKIAEFLTSVDEKIGKLKRKKELLEAYKKGAMQKLFSQEIRFKDDQGNPYPDWEEKRLGEVANIGTGNRDRVDSSAQGIYRFFDRSEDVRFMSEFDFDGEVVVVPGEGQSFNSTYYKGKYSLHQRVYGITNFREVTAKWVYYLVIVDQKHFLSQAVGTTVKSLRTPIFLKWPIPVPSQLEQQKIAEFLTGIDDKITAVANQIEKAAKFKKGLLQKMFV